MALFGGAGISGVLVLTATLALTLPAIGLDPLPESAGVAYGSAPGIRLAPLSSGFIHSILGVLIPGAVSVAPGSVTATAASPKGRVPGAGGGATVVNHPFTNDSIANAYPITTVPFTAHTDMAGATRESNDPTTCSPVGGTAWYRFTPPPSTRVVSVTVLTPFPVALAAFTPPVGSDSQPVPSGLNLPACSRNQRNAAIKLPVSKGQVYYIQVTAISDPGALALIVRGPGSNELVSQSAGKPGNDQSGLGATAGTAISSDGNVVAFQSDASNLDPAHPLGPCNAMADPSLAENATTCSQVYVRDRVRHTTQLISRSAAGASGDGPAFEPSISGDGRYVAFASSASNLVAGDTNATADVFVYDRASGTLTRESVTSSGAQLTDIPGNAGSFMPKLSADGRYLAFTSDALNLPGNDSCNVVTGGCVSVYLRDRLTGAITEVSVDPNGGQVTNDQPYPVAVSRGGRYVAFESSSAEVLPGAQDKCLAQTNPGGSGVQGGNCVEVYRRDMVLGKTILGTRSSSGVPADQSESAHSAAMTSDGRYISFESFADNLVDGDTNNSIDTFRHDFVTGQTMRVSVDSGGNQVTDSNSNGALAGAQSQFSSIADGGDLVVFDSGAAALDFQATPGGTWAYVHVVSTGLTTLLGVTLAGGPSGAAPVISSDGDYTVLMGDGLDRPGTGVNQVYVHRMSEVE